MPSRACTRCKLGFPLRTEYEVCPSCGKGTSMVLLENPPADWEKKLAEIFDGLAESGDEQDKIIAWRVKLLRDMGYTWDQAAKLGARHHGPEKVDVHMIRRHLDRGATRRQAAGIES